MGQSPSKRKKKAQNPIAAPYGYIYGPALPHNFTQGFVPATHPPVYPPGFMPPPPGFMANYPQMQMQVPVTMPLAAPYVWPMTVPIPQEKPTKKRKSSRPTRRKDGASQPATTGPVRTSGSTHTNTAAVIATSPPPIPIPAPTSSEGQSLPHPAAGHGTHGPGQRRTQTPFHRLQDLPEDRRSPEENVLPAGANPPRPGTQTRASQSERRQPLSNVNQEGNPNSRTSQRSPSIARTSAPPRPLPAAPIDVFELPEYKQTIEKLTQMPDIRNDLKAYVRTDLPPKEEPVKKVKRNFFNIFNSKKSGKQQPLEARPSLRIQIPIHPGRVMPTALRRAFSGSSAHSQPQPQASLPVPSPPSPLPGPPREPILFNQDTEHAGLLNHSPFRIRYEDADYPTALHLLEALKFLPRRRDLAEKIRECDDIGDVYPLSAAHAEDMDPNWSTGFLEALEEVVHLKVTQHANLRSLLMSTGNAHLIYNDPTDNYWGCGPDGQGDNVLGTVLERVRVRLFESLVN